VYIFGPSIHSSDVTLEIAIENTCPEAANATVTCTWAVDGALVGTSATLLELRSSNLTTMLGGSSGKEILLRGCKHFNFSTYSETVCKEHRVEVVNGRMPSVSLSGTSVLSPGSSCVIHALITHPLRNLSTSTIGKFAYSWIVRRLARGSRPMKDLELAGTLTNETSLIISPGKLEPRESYEITFSSNFSSAYGPRGIFNISARANTTSRNVVAVISGGHYRQISEVPHGGFEVDASHSFDPEASDTGSSLGRVLNYSWSCYNATNNKACYSFNTSHTRSVAFIQRKYLPEGTRLNITVIFSVLSNEGTLFRSDSASTSVVVVPASRPKVALSGTSSRQLYISRSDTITLVANVLGSTNTPIYEWLLEDTSTLAHTASLYMDLASLPTHANTFTITVRVTDSVTRQISSIMVKLIALDVPSVSSAATTPLNGSAYVTTFLTSVVATSIEIPLHYSFGYRPAKNPNGDIQVLHSFAPENMASFVLPPGNFTIVTSVRDALGGVVSQPAGVVAVMQYRNTTSDAEGSCATAINAVANIRRIIDSSAVLTSDEVPDDDVCDELDLVLEKLLLYELYNQALTLSQNALKEISDIPLDSRAVGTCHGGFGVLRGGRCSAGSLSDLSLGLWTVVEKRTNSFVTGVLSQAGKAAGKEAQVMQVLEATATSPTFSNVSTERANSLSASVEQVISQASPKDLASNIGQSCTVVLSEILRYGLLQEQRLVGRQYASRRNINANVVRENGCELVDSSIRQLDALLKASGNVVPPDSNSGPLRYQSFAFQASVGSAFADEQAKFNTTSVSVLASPSASSSSSIRPQIITGINEIQLDVAKCRPSRMDNGSKRNKDRRLSPVVSINIYNSSGDRQFTSGHTNARYGNGGIVDIVFDELAPDTSGHCGSTSLAQRELRRSCRFWVPEREAWDTSGCRYIAPNASTSSSNSSRGVCRCAHLTEFALFSDHDECSRVESKATHQYLGIFSALIGLYMILGLASMVQSLRLFRVGIDVFSTLCGPHVIALGLCIVRVVSLALIAEIIGGFKAETLHIGGMVVILALPYTFSLALYLLLVFQWISIVHNRKLSKTPFEQVKKCYRASTISAIVACWLIFLVFFFYMRRYDSDLAVTMSAGALVGLFVVIIVAIYAYGYWLIRSMQSTCRDESAEMVFMMVI